MIPRNIKMRLFALKSIFSKFWPFQIIQKAPLGLKTADNAETEKDRYVMLHINSMGEPTREIIWDTFQGSKLNILGKNAIEYF